MSRIITKSMREKRNIKIFFVLVCLLSIICGISTSRNFDFKINPRQLANDIKYRYDANGGYVGLDITLNTLKTGEAAAAQNTIELQNAMNKVSDAGGGNIYLPSGTYYFGPGGYNSTTDKEDFAIKCRNNVHLRGRGTDENSANHTILKPLYDQPYANGGMDMFYFNNYKDSGFKSVYYTPASTETVSYINNNGKTVTWSNQTIYLINADFSDFIIDGDSARGGIATAGGKYRTDGKGFMINLFSDCDWNNVVVKNVDATGFGVDCPINSTIKNCKAINCGKAATQADGGASGFGIGTGYSNDESLVIENSIAINNKKFGFFFEHQAKFNDMHYKATTSKGFVVTNSVAGGNMYDFGGLKSYDTTYENNVSVSNQGNYNIPGLKATNTQPGKYQYSYITFTKGNINLNKVTQPIYFSEYSSNSFAVNTKVYGGLKDITSNEEEIKWAVDSGIIPVKNATQFGIKDSVSRLDTLKAIYAYTGREYPISNVGRVTERANYKKQISQIGFTDLNSEKYQDELDNIVWAYNKSIISKDTKFNPETPCTRAQLVTMLYRMEGSPSVIGKNPFIDVKTGSYYYNAVIWGYNKGIIKGTTSNQFSPNDNLTKQQLAVFLYRYKNVSSRQFKLKVNNIGGVGYNPSTYTRTGNIKLNNPTRTGYTFLGWTGSNGVTPNQNITIKSGTTGNISYTANWTPNLINLFIKQEASIKEYKVGAKLDTKGLIVGAKFGDNNIFEVPNYEISPKVLDKVGTQTITIKYGGLSTSYNVKVTDKKINKISIARKPDNVDYYVGDKIDTTGLELKVLYDDGTSNIVKSGYTVSPTTITKPGTTKVIIKYNGITTSYEVNAKDIQVESIKIKTYPVKTAYYVGEYLETEGLVLSVAYSNGVVKNIDSDYTVNVKKITEPGEQYVTVKYKEKTTKYKITSKKDTITGMIISEVPKKISYFIGEKFDSSGLKIAIMRSSGYKEIINSGYKISIKEGYAFKEKGLFEVKVTYGEYTDKFNLKIYDEKDKILSIIKRPNKTNYVVGEKFTTEGMVIELVSPDGKHIKIDDYKVSLIEGGILTEIGPKKVTVTYKEYSTDFDITVGKVVSLQVNKVSIKHMYKMGEKFDIEDIAVIAQYEDGVKEKLDKQYKVEVEGGNTFTTPGEKLVTVTYGDASTSFRITVDDSYVSNKPNYIIFVIIGTIFVLLITGLVVYVSKKDKQNNQKVIRNKD